ncbi:MAG: Maltooligosyl trehalose synthase [Desulfotomaculum sp. 46_296]|nr:MAG: Maltooligosyl trehalose synthase [Desulfotomaculum sp. 46_296]HAU32457.1 malto-oligosyltrehalose synthase [Desulfotomaculum sp.]
MNQPRIPSATYRLQLNNKFGFREAMALVPYLRTLGITDLYASPVFKARSGSRHGYDTTDPGILNPELGDSEEFFLLTDALNKNGMGLVLDIVPNHMAASSENPRWYDILQNGPGSPFASFFDIDWRSGKAGLNGKVLVPILGEPFGAALENQKILLTLEEKGLQINYNGIKFPLSPDSYKSLIAKWNKELSIRYSGNKPVLTDFKKLLKTLTQLKKRSNINEVIHSLWDLYKKNSFLRSFINRQLTMINGKKGEPDSFSELEQILSQQAYRLACWRVADEKVNYRRFFDVSELVCLHTEKKSVFDHTHHFILKLISLNKINGLRIDHIDGLWNPQAYLSRLQKTISKKHSGFFIVVEKILTDGERLPVDWPVSGTTGYDFLNNLNKLFVDSKGIEILDEIYARLSGYRSDFTSLLRSRKRFVIKEIFAAETDNLLQRLAYLACKNRYGSDIKQEALNQALIETTACLRVYRTYIKNFNVEGSDRFYILDALAAARRRRPEAGQGFDFLQNVLLLDLKKGKALDRAKDWLEFVMRWQQFTGPVMAKGCEDTALYVFNRLISFNEVGSNPGTTGISVDEFHRRNRTRLQLTPHTMNTTSTHDTKRSEDVRARINVLTEIPELWSGQLAKWRRYNLAAKKVINNQTAPDGNMEYLIYQTLVGTWPLNKKEIPVFRKRLNDYLIKAAREAKLHTSWLQPDKDYEDALVHFIGSILEPSESNMFLNDFIQFHKTISYYGAINSLAQVLLKITSPGIPDFYQGTELWDLSLVDPDNRRPVDYSKRSEAIEKINTKEVVNLERTVKYLLKNWENGWIKLFLTYKALNFRKIYKDLFERGDYLPLECTGKGLKHVCSFARHMAGRWIICAVVRLPASLIKENGENQPRNHNEDAGFMRAEPPTGKAVWGNSALILPGRAPDSWKNILTGEKIEDVKQDQADRKELPIAGTMKILPVALLTGFTMD